LQEINKHRASYSTVLLDGWKYETFSKPQRVLYKPLEDPLQQNKKNAVSEHAVNHFSFGKILNLHPIHEVQYAHARPKATIIKPGVNCITRLVNLQ
jgi:hypothetical protein